MGLLSLLLSHPEDIPPLLRVQAASRRATLLPSDPHLAFCYDTLNRVSRSFAVVIQQLDTELRDAVCVFYLVLRALDTVEDDMSIPEEVKLPILRSFHQNIYDPNWKFVCGEGDYKRLMENSPHMATAFINLKEEFQVVIADITKRMGHGMAKFITMEVETTEDYDEYCGYVAGLVGIGLSDLFASSGLEQRADDHLCNSMGLFLQKTNIIRDYLEDINELPMPRMFWPRDIWGKHAKTLEDLKSLPASQSLPCLNEMVSDALRHAPDCLLYMRDIQTESIFRFCAIPQIMAIGTLALCFNNVEVFRGVVKMRRGLSARIMDGTRSLADVKAAFATFAADIEMKISTSDPVADLTRCRISAIFEACGSDVSKATLNVKESTATALLLLLSLLLVLLLAVSVTFRSLTQSFL